MLEGALDGLDVGLAVPAGAQAGTPASYRLRMSAPLVRAATDGGKSSDPEPGVNVNALLGRVLDIEYLGRITCGHCGRQTRKSFAQGYCYPCFRSLARCDLCVVSPDRCHFAAGTCREPDWGEAFCMQPHLVYLANSSGPKVGITRRGRERNRWLDQGAIQGLVILEAPTRHLAGLAEVALGRYLTDRTDWRALVRGDAEPVDLAALRDAVWVRLQGQRDAESRALPEGVCRTTRYPPVSLRYPILRYPRLVRRFRLERDGRVRGRLVGVKGQFLLFEEGVLNIRQHTGFHVRLSWEESRTESRTESPPASAAAPCRDQQMELFRP